MVEICSLPAAAGRCLCAGVVAVIASAGAAFGQTDWQNPAGGDFGDGANWSGGMIPAPDGQARFGIGGASYIVGFGADQQVGGVAIDGDDVTFDLGMRQLQFGGNAWNLDVGTGVAPTTSRLRLNGGDVSPDLFAFSGVVAVGPTARLDVNGSHLQGNDVSATVDGRLDVNGGGQVFWTGLSEVTVNGVATVDGSTSFISPAFMTVNGQLQATNGGRGGAGNGLLALSSGAVAIADGGEIFGQGISATGAHIQLANGGRIESSFGPFNLDAGSTLSGSGQVIAFSAVNAGVIEPGLTGGGIGSLFFSDLEMAGSGRVVMELAGLGAGTGHDVVNVDFTSLTGTLDVFLAGGFSPSVGDSFDLFKGPRIGQFSTVNLPSLGGGLSFDLLYGDDFVRLNVVPTPSAAAGALLGFGLLGLRRRR